MTDALHKDHHIAGQLVAERDSGRAVALAADAADTAFDTYSRLSGAERAVLLDAIADEMTARGPAIIAAAMAESGLPDARITGELGRTTGQLRLFADHVRAGRHLDLRHDPALPDRKPAPRPDLRLMQVAIGPVAVFGASNFPLAFSVAGGDTASALAAGCPVVVKEHSAHPLTSQRVAAAIDAAIARTGVPRGVFSLIRAQDRAAGTELVTHPRIKAVGFTGSLTGGKALFDLCAARPEPIPFFGELGAVNPMFILPAALALRGEAIAQGWAASLTMGAGQFCTNPGIAILPAGPAAEAFARAASLALSRVHGQTMLTDGIAAAYRKGLDALDRVTGVTALLRNDQSGREALPNLARVDGATFLSEPHLAEEIFGPAGLLVVASDRSEMLAIARGLQGQLTATLHLDDADHAEAAPLLQILSRKAGRLLANGFPTGVEVCDAMVHGGPYPASTNFGATSVGTLAIRRFLRPLCFQDIPADLLPAELR